MPQTSDKHEFKVTLSSNRVGDGREKDFGDIVATYPDLDYEALINLQHAIVAAINEALFAAGKQMLDASKKGGV